MDCHHFNAGRCRSCTWLPRPYDAQLAATQEQVSGLLAEFTGLDWEEPFRSAEHAFRNKAKMVVTGTIQDPCLGILGEPGTGVDLRDCGLYVAPITAALPVIAEFVTRAGLRPYDVAMREGELKFVIVTASPDDDLMVRFVARSQEPVTRIAKHLPWLLEKLPQLVVASVNLQPEHKAVLEGDHEILLTDTADLVMRLNGLDLLVRPGSFFQTNTAVAAGLYRTARDWGAGADTVWDLYCGVGGFALHLAEPGRRVLGLESSAEAVASAVQSAHRADLNASFLVGDAARFARDADAIPGLVVVNPPRRGIGADLAGWLERSGVPRVLYSSCNPESLARDVAAMPSLVPQRARVFDMFPHTAHAEVLTLLERVATPAG